MTRSRKRLVRIVTAVAGLLPALALAHPGHGDTSSFVAGAMHPLDSVGHVLWLVQVGLLTALLGRRYVGPVSALFLGVLIAASTSANDAWQYVAGFMSTSAGLIAATMATTRAATRLLQRSSTAAAPRSPI